MLGRAFSAKIVRLPCWRKHKPTCQWCGFPARRRVWPLRSADEGVGDVAGPLSDLDPVWKIVCVSTRRPTRGVADIALP